MKSLRKLITEYEQNPTKMDREIEMATIPQMKPTPKKPKPKPLYWIQKRSVPIYDAKDITKKENHRYLRTMGLEQYSKLGGDIVQLFQDTETKKRFGVKIN